MSNPMCSFSRLTVLIPSLLLVAPTFQTLFLSPALAQSQQLQPQNCQTFPETGRLSCDKFLSYWQSHGGVAHNRASP